MATAVFLAFEPADASAGSEIAGELEKRGVVVRRSEAALRDTEGAPGLGQAVSETDAMLVLLSPAANNSPALRREISAALNNGRPIVPILLGEVALDSWLAAALDPERIIDMRARVSADRFTEIVEAASAASKRGRVIALLNIKGGVGKTVLAANLFAAAHLFDKRSVSFVDLDPQHNLTQYFLPPVERHRLRAANGTMYGVLASQGDLSKPRAEFETMPIPLNRSRQNDLRFDLVAGDERLFEFTLDTRSELDKAQGFARFHALITMLRAKSEVVVIDANPCATFLTRLAVAAADHIVAPVRPEKYSLTGLNMLEAVVREVRGRPLRPGEFSVLLNGVNDRTRSDAQGDGDAVTRAEIAAAPFFGSALLDEAVPYSGSLKSTPVDRYAANPINVTAMMRAGGRSTKEALAQAAAAVFKRAGL